MMRIYKKKMEISPIKQAAIILSFLMLFVFFFYALNVNIQKTEDESEKNTKAAIEKAIINCFALEGKYPMNIEYLEENYMVYIDREKYVAYLQEAGTNFAPKLVFTYTTEYLEKRG